MSESSSNDHPANKKRGAITKTFDFVSKIVGVLLFSAFVSVLIEWVGMTWFYPDTGYEHAETMMRKEIGYLGGSVTEDDSNSGAVSTASGVVTDIVNYIFIDSGLVDGLVSLKIPDPEDGIFISHTKAFFADYFDYLMAAVYVLIMFMIRLAILVLSVPAFLMFGLVGLSDGLMQRDLRRWCGGNESGFIYHWAKKFALPVLVIAWIVYLAIPNSIHPNMIITPFAVLFGLVIMVMASKFKKYL